MKLNEVDPQKLAELSDEDFRLLLSAAARFQAEDLKENALLYYKPISPKVLEFHKSDARVVGMFGGNGSSKTESSIVEMLIAATGVVPVSLQGIYDIKKCRGPMNCRIICESLTTTLHNVILPKMQWWKWTGVDGPGGKRGHWGWIPRNCLIEGSWEKSWSERYRTLRILCRDPVNPEIVVGESTIQLLSHDQDPSDFASGDFHYVLFDEPPKYATWRENQARTMRVRGRMVLAMTWPDEPTIPVDWIFDELYDKAQNKTQDHEVYELYTTENKNLDQDAVAQQMANWSEATRKVRIYGQAMRFSNLIHPLFTDVSTGWCFKCKSPAVLEDEKCIHCGAEDVTVYNHVKDFDYSHTWPVTYILDPHPRKPHMMAWVAVDTFDDLWVVAEADVEGDPTEVYEVVTDIEKLYGLRVSHRLIDPNMGASPSGVKREVSWRDEFNLAGIRCDLASDSDVGRSRINEFLKPDARRLQPRLHVHSRCKKTIFQMKRYVWDEYKNAAQKDLKQKPKEKYDDYPTILKYCMNAEPIFTTMARGSPVLHREGRRSGY